MKNEDDGLEGKNRSARSTLFSYLSTRGHRSDIIDQQIISQS